MTVQVGDIIRVTCKMGYAAGAVQNVYHYKHIGSGSVPDATFMSALGTEMNTNYTTINAYLAPGFMYHTIEAFNVTQDAPIDEIAWPSLTVGTGSGTDSYATQCAALVKFPTATARSQGRKYLGGLMEGYVGSGGLIESAFLTALGSFATAMLSGFSAGGEDFEAGNWNPSLARFAAWIAGVVADRVATQRRRRAGVGI